MIVRGLLCALWSEMICNASRGRGHEQDPDVLDWIRPSSTGSDRPRLDLHDDYSPLPIHVVRRLSLVSFLIAVFMYDFYRRHCSSLRRGSLPTPSQTLAMADLGSLYERELLAELSERGNIDSSVELAERKGWDHTRLASVIRSLHGARMVVPEEKERTGWAVTEEAKVSGGRGRERERERERERTSSHRID